jgi:hypothetical protein
MRSVPCQRKLSYWLSPELPVESSEQSTALQREAHDSGQLDPRFPSFNSVACFTRSPRLPKICPFSNFSLPEGRAADLQSRTICPPSPPFPLLPRCVLNTRVRPGKHQLGGSASLHDQFGRSGCYCNQYRAGRAPCFSFYKVLMCREYRQRTACPAAMSEVLTGRSLWYCQASQ